VGWLTQRGVTMTGSRSASAHTISNERLPEPITIEARSSIVGTPDSRRMRPTSWRLRRWRDSPGSRPRPPRYAIRRPPAARAAAAKFTAARRSSASKSPREPIEWTR